jgi:LAS superfamily LD-carboxypeptidase LdcB
MEEAQTVGDTDRQAEVKARLDELAAIVEAPKRGADTRKAKAEADARAKAKADADAAAAKAKADAEAAAQAKAEAALRPVPVGRPTGTYPAVPCPGGGSITIDGSLAHNLNAMLLAARNDGINLCGGGYRDPNRQIQLRIQNCGSSTYAIYQMPPGSCLPPTAIPGTSSHERGLAIDFRCAGQGIPTRSSPCFQWMAAHAAGFGFFNLPSEPWHWSTTGS